MDDKKKKLDDLKEKVDDMKAKMSKLDEEFVEGLSDILARVTYQHVYLMCLQMGVGQKYPDATKFRNIVAELSKAYVMNMFSFQKELGDSLPTEVKVSRASTLADEVCKTSIRAMLAS